MLASKGPLDWNKRDEKGYTPLMLASFHDNAWLVKHLIEQVKVRGSPCEGLPVWEIATCGG